MRWLSTNWLWIAFIGAMLLMHLRHGSMHGGHHGHDRQAHGVGRSEHDDAGAASADAGSSTTGHRHGGH